MIKEFEGRCNKIKQYFDQPLWTWIAIPSNTGSL